LVDNFQIGVGQKDKRQIVFFDKFFMGFDGVFADADYDPVVLFEFFVMIPERAGLHGAARSIVFGVKINHFF
jgi:hypothetical protein